MKKNLLRLLKMGTYYSLIGILMQVIFYNMIFADHSVAQKVKNLEEVEFSLEIRQASLVEIFQMIEDKTEFKFTFERKDLNPDLKLSFDGTLSLKELLLNISKEAALGFRQINYNIDVRKLSNNEIKKEQRIKVEFQTRNISGKVTSEDEGEGLPGVNVVEKGTSNGTVTNVQGEYTLEVSEGATLVFSSVGYTTEEVEIGNRSTIDLVMVQDIQQLEELVVVGFGMQQSKDLTSPIDVIDAKDLETRPVANVVQAIQGQVPGVTVVQNGAPGSNPTVRIRGIGSIEGSSDPLYVVDGVFTRDISFLGPNDIKNITFLKEASAASIYGIRGANGVIVITTKDGKTQGDRVQYSGYYGMRQAANMLEMANADQYITLINEKRRINNNSETLDPSQFNADTDWFDLLLRTATIQSHNLNVSGGSSTSNYSFGVGYLDEEGIIEKTDYQRINIRATGDFKEGNHFAAGFSTNLAPSFYTNQGAQNGLLNAAFITPPVIPPYDANGNFVDPMEVANLGQLPNPALTLRNLDQKSEGLRIMFSGFAELSFLDDALKLRSNIGLEYNNIRSRTYNRAFFVSEGLYDSIPTLSKTRSNTRNYYWDNTLSFEKSYGDHKIQSTLGMTVLEETSDWMIASRQGVEDFGESSYYLNLGDADGQTNNDGGIKIRGLSYFGRLFYSFKQRYLMTFTLRSDGSSTFSQANRWGTFPSLGLGWVISEEPFFNNIASIDFLKLRGSYGMLGNNNIPQNEFTVVTSRAGKYSVVLGDQLRTGENIISAVAPDLRWEVVKEYNFGLEGTAFNNRLDFGIDYYHRLTQDALFSVLLTGASGSSGVFFDNNADILNQGFEVQLGFKDDINENWRFGISGNLTTINNKVTKLKTGTMGIRSGDVLHGNLSNYTTEGLPIAEFHVLEVIGVFQDEQEVEDYVHTDADGNTEKIQPKAIPGDLKYKDQNEDGVIDRLDYVRSGNNIPDFTYGLNFELGYKNWNLLVNVYGVSGTKVYNRKLVHRFGDQNENYPAYFYGQRWNGKGTTNSAPSADIGGRDNLLPSTYYLEDGDFFRINNLQIGYTIPKPLLDKVGISNLMIYAHAQNPLTIFEYNGFTPEIPNNDPLAQGIDGGVYPISSTYSLGVNFSF